MSKLGHALKFTDDKPEWIEDCINCPLPECIDCRNAQGQSYMEKPLEGCICEETFLREYNSGTMATGMARRLDVPRLFLTELLTSIGLPWRIKEIRPEIMRKDLYALPDRVRALFG